MDVNFRVEQRCVVARLKISNAVDFPRNWHSVNLGKHGKHSMFNSSASASTLTARCRQICPSSYVVFRHRESLQEM